MPTDTQTFYAGHARRGAVYGSLEQLEALQFAFLGVNRYLLLTVSYAAAGFWAFLRVPDWSWTFVLVGPLIVGILSAKTIRAIGFAKRWSQGRVEMALVLTMLSAPLAFGFPTYAILRRIVHRELCKYGVTSGFPGVNEKRIQTAIDGRVDDDARSANMRWAA